MVSISSLALLTIFGFGFFTRFVYSVDLLNYNDFFGIKDDFEAKEVDDDASFLSKFSPIRFLETLLNISYDTITKIEFIFHPINDSDVKFFLYRSGTFRHIYDLNFINNILAEIESNAPIKFIVHGYRNSGTEQWVKDMAHAYENIGVKNVFSVDWSSHSKRGYLEASKATLYVGKIVAKFIKKLVDLNPNFFNQIHIIGFSLGAHAAGFAGKEVERLFNKKLQRITYLDPAGPLFEMPILRDGKMRATESDAVFTDAYHTSAGYFGFNREIATVDVYLHNGGPIQPPCVKMGILRALTCSHSRAHGFWTKAIEHKITASDCATDFLDIIIDRCLLLGSAKHLIGEQISRSLKGRYHYQRILDVLDSFPNLKTLYNILG